MKENKNNEIVKYLLMANNPELTKDFIFKKDIMLRADQKTRLIIEIIKDPDYIMTDILKKEIIANKIKIEVTIE